MLEAVSIDELDEVATDVPDVVGTAAEDVLLEDVEYAVGNAELALKVGNVTLNGSE